MPAINANIDYISPDGDGYSGEVAGALMNGGYGGLSIHERRPWLGRDGRAYINKYKGVGNFNDIKNYTAVPIDRGIGTYGTTLRKEEWRRLDDALVRTRELRLGIIEAIANRGLNYDFDGMRSTVLTWHTLKGNIEAEMSMDGITKAENDRPVYDELHIPLPIIHADFEILTRELNMSRNLGQPLDTTMVEVATRSVAETVVNMLFTDKTYTFGGGSIKSFLNHGDRNTVSFENSRNWADAAKTADGIITDVIAMMKKSIEDRYHGPWSLFIPTAYQTELLKDYNATSGKTVRERILGLNGIEEIISVDYLTGNNILLVQMTSDVIRIIRGMRMQVIEWKSEGGMRNHYKVLTIQVPQLRSDANKRMGVVHMS